MSFLKKYKKNVMALVMVFTMLLTLVPADLSLAEESDKSGKSVESIAKTEDLKKGGDSEVKVDTSSEKQSDKGSTEKTTDKTTEADKTEAKTESLTSESQTEADNVDITTSETSEQMTEADTSSETTDGSTSETTSETTEASTETEATTEKGKEKDGVKAEKLELEEDEIPVYHHDYSGYKVSLDGHTADGYWKISVKNSSKKVNVLCMDHGKKMMTGIPCKNASLEHAATTSKDKYFVAVAWALMNKGLIDQDAAIPLAWQKATTSDSDNQSYYGKAYAYADAAYDASKINGNKYSRSVEKGKSKTVVSMPNSLLKKIATNAYGFKGEGGEKVETSVSVTDVSWSDGSTNTQKIKASVSKEDGKITIKKEDGSDLPTNEITEGSKIIVNLQLNIPGAAKQLDYLDFSTYYEATEHKTYLQRLACGYSGTTYSCKVVLSGNGTVDIPITAFKCGPFGRLDDDCTFRIAYLDATSLALVQKEFSPGEVITINPSDVWSASLTSKVIRLQEIKSPENYNCDNLIYQIKLIQDSSYIAQNGYRLELITADNPSKPIRATMRWDGNLNAWYLDTSCYERQLASPQENDMGFYNKPALGGFELKKETASWAYDASTKTFKLQSSDGNNVTFALYAASDIYVPGYEGLEQARWKSANEQITQDVSGSPLTLTTDTQGKLTVENLYPGNYYLIEQQKSLPTVGTKTDIDGKVFRVVADGIIQITSENESAIVYNKPTHISASIRKEDENSKPIAGAEFTLYAYVKNPSGNKTAETELFPSSSAESAIIGVHNGVPEMSPAEWVPVATTTSTAEEEGDNVVFDIEGPIGYYMIAETKLPSGFTYSDYDNYEYAFNVGTRMIYNNQSVNVFANNIGDIFPDDAGCKNVEAPVSGLKEVVDAGSGAIYQNDKILVNQSTKVSIQLYKSGDIMTGAEAVTTPYGVYKRIVFTKKMALDGVTFELWQGNDKIATRVTDMYGRAEFANNDTTGEALLPGEYCLKEVNNGGSYRTLWGKEGKKITITSEENVQEVVNVQSWENEFVNTSISLQKKGEVAKAIADTRPEDVDFTKVTPTIEQSTLVQDGDYVPLEKYQVYEKDTIDLEGAVFGLFASEDITAYNGEVIINQDDCVGIAVSDSTGKVEFTEKLKQGKYYVKEIKTSSNQYQLSSEEYPVDVVHKNEDAVIEIGDVTNELYEGSITIVKVDAKDETKRLEGVTFNLYDGDKKLLGAFKTDSQGRIVITGLPVGKYFIKEISSLDGYILDGQEYSVYVTAKNLYQVKTISNERCHGKIKVIKVDAENHEYKLQGVVFELLDNNKNVLGSYVTDANGEIVTEELPYGTYFLRETVTQAGYILDNTEYKVDITDENRFPELTVYNSSYKGSIKVIKTNGDKTIYLKGVVFNLLDSNQNILGTYTTDERGEIYITGLRCGTYYVQETVTNKGYTLDNSLYQIDLTETNLDQILELVNEESKVKVTDSEDLSTDSEDSSSVKTGVNNLLIFLLLAFVFAILAFAFNENRNEMMAKLLVKHAQTDLNDEASVGKTKATEQTHDTDSHKQV